MKKHWRLVVLDYLVPGGVLDVKPVHHAGVIPESDAQTQTRQSALGES